MFNRSPEYKQVDSHETLPLGFRPVQAQSGRLGHRSLLDTCNLKYRDKRDYTNNAVKNKGADQPVHMSCAFAFRIRYEQIFSRRC